MNAQILINHILVLSRAYRVELEDDYSSLIVQNFHLPPGYNRSIMRVKLEVPKDYPESPPGVGNSHVYLPKGLRYRGRTPSDYHESKSKNEWVWWCYQKINWDPCHDDLITFFEVLRSSLTNPPLED